MPRLRSDLLPALLACGGRRLGTFSLRWKRRGGAVRRHGGEGLSRRGRARLGDPRPRRGRLARRRARLPCRHAPRGDRILANGGRVLGVTALGRQSPRRRRAPMRRSIRSTGRTASAAATSAGVRSERLSHDAAGRPRPRRRRRARPRPYPHAGGARRARRQPVAIAGTSMGAIFAAPMRPACRGAKSMPPRSRRWPTAAVRAS